MQLLRLFRTVRHLRPVQIYGRIWHRLYRPRIDRRSSAPVRQFTGEWQPGCERPVSLINAETFRFLNVTAPVRNAADWNHPGRTRLWTYNAHYFDDLNAVGAATRTPWHRSLVARWIVENPPPMGTAWEPYPTSLRVVNWIKWSLLRGARGETGLDQVERDSLAMQVRWLSKRLEIHLLGNHLWANAKALVFAGAFFRGEEASGWLRTGLKLVERELDEQVLSDGGHFERSPMYHAIVLEDVLDLVNLSRTAPGAIPGGLVARLKSVATRMHRWLRVMTHPDGQIALFNDAAFGIASDEAPLAEYARRLGVPVSTDSLGSVEALPDSGYVRLQNERAVTICDVAPIGPDHLPGHAHADTLSFELSLDGRRVIVNSGTSTYETGNERQRQRGTAAHNTVEIDGLDSSEVWGGFRVARRARPRAVAWGCDERCSWLEGVHDGYRRTPGRVTHHRRWVLDENALTIADSLTGSFDCAVASLHLHPAVAVSDVHGDGAGALLTLPAGCTVKLGVTPPAARHVRPSSWHREFGRSEPNVVLRLPITGSSLTARVSW